MFGSKHGKVLSQPTMSGYWRHVCARAGLQFDFYLATKHRAVHHLYVELGLLPHVIAAQLGTGFGTRCRPAADVREIKVGGVGWTSNPDSGSVNRTRRGAAR